eukprot:scaffold29438_cov17-Tisochrysis_lutea.AAC.1
MLQANELATRVQAVPAREAMLGALRQCLTRPIQMQAHQGPGPSEGDTELEQAFARLSTKQQEQPSSEAVPAQGKECSSCLCFEELQERYTGNN